MSSSLMGLVAIVALVKENSSLRDELDEIKRPSYAKKAYSKTNCAKGKPQSILLVLGFLILIFLMVMQMINDDKTVSKLEKQMIDEYKEQVSELITDRFQRLTLGFGLLDDFKIAYDQAIMYGQLDKNRIYVIAENIENAARRLAIDASLVRSVCKLISEDTNETGDTPSVI